MADAAKGSERTVTGGCQCGAIRYSVGVALPPAYACHCGECKKQSASAFSMSIPMYFDMLDVTGSPKVYESKAFSGRPKYNFFCGDCGTRLWHSGTNPPTAITLKVGTLDQGADIAPVEHLWVSQKQAGIMLDPKTVQHQTQPDDVIAWRKKLEQ
ncbi:MAG: GFA family protein [Parasphingorhabdus sp.]|uniref:GFA family protein n=1 Tax=Parasphingorhabdus sp. TaxID=2709688 RepID=UPI0032980D8B